MPPGYHGQRAQCRAQTSTAHSLPKCFISATHGRQSQPGTAPGKELGVVQDALSARPGQCCVPCVLLHCQLHVACTHQGCCQRPCVLPHSMLKLNALLADGSRGCSALGQGELYTGHCRGGPGPSQGSWFQQGSQGQGKKGVQQELIFQRTRPLRVPSRDLSCSWRCLAASSSSALLFSGLPLRISLRPGLCPAAAPSLRP